MTVLGAAVLLVLALASPRLSALLLRKPLRFLGKVSYSLYLYHVVVLLTALNLLYGLLNLWLILFLALLVTFAVTVGAYYGIEAPAHRAGQVSLGQEPAADKERCREVSGTWQQSLSVGKGGNRFDTNLQVAPLRQGTLPPLPASLRSDAIFSGLLHPRVFRCESSLDGPVGPVIA